MKSIKFEKNAIIKEFMPSYLFGWGIFCLSIFTFSLMSFGNDSFFTDILLNVLIACVGAGILIWSISVAINGFGFVLSDDLRIDKNGVEIELPKLTNFRDSSDFNFEVINEELVIYENKFKIAHFDKTMANIGFECKILDENDNEIPIVISCFQSISFNLLVYPKNRSDLKRAKKMIISSEKELVTKIHYVNNVRF
ncbi:hypothetical protein NDJ00_11495 [Vibrio parahaemolyticus]|uniref:hypothetical protein n=1 Tax=Vibrio parahaemolyticus TaxID=670 RepID=UPI00215FB203|nr:hypothetical protein [Vibrio parahaemolyticus]MCS0114793.1 hypothetical protein [Vibrio parahaemolyticus]